ncbi:MAG: GSCFA domain-containing protein, partial [Bacteroidia bacterium]
MKFKLDFEIEKRPILSKFGAISLLGSCFAQNQALNFSRSGFETMSNPFGVFYNPVSIAQLLSRMDGNKLYSSEDFISNGEQYFSLEHHGSCKFNQLDDAINSSNQILQDFESHLKKSRILVLSFGTSLVYKHKAKNKIVANCHRLASKEFNHQQLSLEDCL